MKIINLIFIYTIKFYQNFISPLLGQNWRFIPTCSTYCLESFQKHNTILKNIHFLIMTLLKDSFFLMVQKLILYLKVLVIKTNKEK